MRPTRLLNANQERQPCLGAYNSNIPAVELSLALLLHSSLSSHCQIHDANEPQNKSSQESQRVAHHSLANIASLFVTISKSRTRLLWGGAVGGLIYCVMGYGGDLCGGLAECMRISGRLPGCQHSSRKKMIYLLVQRLVCLIRGQRTAVKIRREIICWFSRALECPSARDGNYKIHIVVRTCPSLPAPKKRKKEPCSTKVTPVFLSDYRLINGLYTRLVGRGTYIAPCAVCLKYYHMLRRIVHVSPVDFSGTLSAVGHRTSVNKWRNETRDMRWIFTELLSNFEPERPPPPGSDYYSSLVVRYSCLAVQGILCSRMYRGTAGGFNHCCMQPIYVILGPRMDLRYVHTYIPMFWSWLAKRIPVFWSWLAKRDWGL